MITIPNWFFQDEEEDGSEVEDEESESEVGEERVPTPKNMKEDEDLDTDQETDRLLGQQYNDDNGYYDQKVKKKYRQIGEFNLFECF